MKDRTKLAKYFSIFMNIVEKPRCTITQIAKNLGHTGAGQRRATISEYLNHMYERKISLKPNLFLKDYQNICLKAYLCKKNRKSSLSATFNKLRNDKKINYVLFISGNCDFFLTSRDETLDLAQYDLQIIESSTLFSPLFTIPRGWELSFEEASNSFLECTLEKGNLPRKAEAVLEWKDLDMKIFELMHENARRPFTEVAAQTDVYSSTIKDHFYKCVLPHCTVAHYFFPRGYESYMQSLIRIHTDYEKALIHAFEKLPCTTYVYPFEHGLLVSVLHENINILVTLIGKMEENGLIEQSTLYTPLWHTHI